MNRVEISVAGVAQVAGVTQVAPRVLASAVVAESLPPSENQQENQSRNRNRNRNRNIEDLPVATVVATPQVGDERVIAELQSGNQQENQSRNINRNRNRNRERASQNNRHANQQNSRQGNITMEAPSMIAESAASLEPLPSNEGRQRQQRNRNRNRRRDREDVQ
ncbi:MAG TPA: hypothetical protein VJK54_11345 [Chthoniobacterales bacterium]|nr:hypothetical protein [Chthoniobacterales bacterium]